MDTNTQLMKADLALAKYEKIIRQGGRVQVAAGGASIITRWTEDQGSVVLHDKIPDYIDGVALYEHYTPWYLALPNNSSHDAQQAKDSRKWAPDQIGTINVISGGIPYFNLLPAIKHGDPGQYTWIHGTQPFPNMVAGILPYKGLHTMYVDTQGLYDADIIAVCPGDLSRLIYTDNGGVIAHSVGGAFNDAGEFEPNSNSSWPFPHWEEQADWDWFDRVKQTFIAPGSASSSVGEVAGAIAVLRLLANALELEITNRELLAILSDTAAEVDVLYRGELYREPVLIDLLAACDHVEGLAAGNSGKVVEKPEPLPEPEPQPEPEPEPEPGEQMTVYEDPGGLFRVMVPARLVNGPLQNRGNRREGLANMFRPDRKKTLFWRPLEDAQIEAFRPAVIDLYRTANDDERFPERSLTRIMGEDLDPPASNFTEIPLSIPLSPGVYPFDLRSAGPLMQVSYLRIRPADEAPPPPPPEPPKPEISTITILTTEIEETVQLAGRVQEIDVEHPDGTITTNSY